MAPVPQEIKKQQKEYAVVKSLTDAFTSAFKVNEKALRDAGIDDDSVKDIMEKHVPPEASKHAYDVATAARFQVMAKEMLKRNPKLDPNDGKAMKSAVSGLQAMGDKDKNTLLENMDAAEKKALNGLETLTVGGGKKVAADSAEGKDAIAGAEKSLNTLRQVTNDILLDPTGKLKAEQALPPKGFAVPINPPPAIPPAKQQKQINNGPNNAADEASLGELPRPAIPQLPGAAGKGGRT